PGRGHGGRAGPGADAGGDAGPSGRSEWLFGRPPGDHARRTPLRRQELAHFLDRRVGGSMDFGAAIFFTDYSMGPVELGRALEERGVESVWAPEHSHIPLSRRAPFPQSGGLPKKYYDVMDPFVTLAAAAGAPSTLKVGTGICLVVQRDPLHTAKQVATIDQISNGRFLFGIGAGWNAEEMADHGTEFASRFEVMRERVEAMKAIWTKSKSEYDGKFV